MDYTKLEYIDDLQQSGFDTVRIQFSWKKDFLSAYHVGDGGPRHSIRSVPGRTGGALAGVAIAISIAVVYIGMAGLFEAMGNANELPAMLAAWSPDFIFAFASGYLLLKVPT